MLNMSRHVIMSYHVVTLETDPNVFYHSMVQIWLENKKNCLKMCHAPFSHDKHVNENMSNMSRHVIIPWSKSGLKTIKWSEIWSETSATPPFHMISMSTKTCQTYIENLKLVGSVQRGSNPDQNVKFNHYKKAGSSGVKGRVRSYSIYKI